MTKKLIWIIGAIIILIAPIFLLLMSPDIESEQSFCPFKMLTGMPCPGCGITKSMVFFYKGEWLKSVSYHIFGPVFIFFCVATILLQTTEIFTGKSYFDKWIFSKKLAYGLAIFLGIYHIIRLVYFLQNHSFAEILKESIWR